MKRSSIKRRVIRAGMISVLGSGVSIVLGMGVRSLVARVWGPQGMGEYAGFMMFLSLFGTFAAFSLPRAVLKFTAEYEETGRLDRIRALFSSVFLFLTLTCLVIALFSLVFSPLLGRLIHLPVDGRRALLLGATLFLGTYSILSSTLFLGLFRNVLAFAISVSSLIAMAALAAYAYLAHLFPVYLLLVAGYLVSGVLGLLLARRQGVLSLRFDGGELKRALLFSAPLFLVAGLDFLVEWFDRFSLGVYFGPEEMGIFSAGLVVFSAARRLPLSLTEVLVPSYAKISLSGKEVLGRAVNKNIAFYALVFFFLTLLFVLYAREIVVLLFSGAFAPAANVLAIMSGAFVFSAITNPGSSLLIGCGYTRLNSLNYAAGVAVLVPSLLVFTRLWGTTGAAAAKLLTHAVTTAGMLFILKKALRVPIDLRSPLKLLLFSAAVGGAILLLKRAIPSLAVGLGALGVLYFGGAWFLVLSSGEKAYLREIFRQAREGRKILGDPAVAWPEDETSTETASRRRGS